jgi:nucleotide-binding universal stress UspA family protein
MFDNIIVGLKEGLHHGPLLDLARKSAAPGARIHLVTLIRAGAYEDEPGRLKKADRDLEMLATSLANDAFDATHESGLIVASAASDIVKLATDRNADLIIIGLAKRTRVGKALMGSDAQRVLLGAQCPVLVTHMYS